MSDKNLDMNGAAKIISKADRLADNFAVEEHRDSEFVERFRREKKQPLLSITLIREYINDLKDVISHYTNDSDLTSLVEESSEIITLLQSQSNQKHEEALKIAGKMFEKGLEISIGLEANKEGSSQSFRPLVRSYLQPIHSMVDQYYHMKIDERIERENRGF